MANVLKAIIADVRIGLRELREQRAARPTAPSKADAQSLLVGLLVLGFFVATAAYTSEAADQAKTIRELRSTMRDLMQPSIRLAEVAPNEMPYLEFMGSACTDDCSGHAAGWKWAVRQNVTTDDQCLEAHSESFREGCQAYLLGMGYVRPEPG